MLDLSQIADLPLSTPDANTARAEFMKVQIRAVIKEPYEHVRAYCKESSQLQFCIQHRGFSSPVTSATAYLMTSGREIFRGYQRFGPGRRSHPA
jgi:hypothetical protein